MFRVKITVQKCDRMEGLISEYAKDGVMDPCPYFKEGQVFYADRMDVAPEGFCSWAWSDLHKEVLTLLSGGDFFWMKDPGTAIACCTDGFRTVYFLLEREFVPTPGKAAAAK